MKKGLASLEVHYLVQELQWLVGGRIHKIYAPSRKALVLQLHIPTKGNQQLAIDEKSFYLTHHKTPAKEPSDFCMYLRKKLNNARLTKLDQVGFERILAFDFHTQEGTLQLICELFSKGNIILTKNKKILTAAEYQKWFFPMGVPTAMKITLPLLIAWSLSVVKLNLPSLVFLRTSSFNPGS